MRTSPDVGVEWEPSQGDLSQPALRSALLAGRARAWQHGRWWTADPDCLLVRPEVAERERWAAHVATLGGLATSGDPLAELDARGVELTRAGLRPATVEPLADEVVTDLLHQI